MTLLPVDSNDNVIPALALKPDGAKTVSAMTSISTRNATPFDSATRVLSLYADVPVYIRFGEANIYHLLGLYHNCHRFVRKAQALSLLVYM